MNFHLASGNNIIRLSSGLKSLDFRPLFCFNGEILITIEERFGCGHCASFLHPFYQYNMLKQDKVGATDIQMPDVAFTEQKNYIEVGKYEYMGNYTFRNGRGSVWTRLFTEKKKVEG